MMFQKDLTLISLEPKSPDSVGLGRPKDVSNSVVRYKGTKSKWQSVNQSINQSLKPDFNFRIDFVRGPNPLYLDL